MATVRYTVIGGRIVAENRGGSRKYYSSDALGSTVALYDNTQTMTDAFAYWPYDETRTSSGSTPTKYKFVGTLGCREQADGGIYMGARVEQPEDGRWMTVDPLWPMETACTYALNSPVTLVAPFGFSDDPCKPGGSNRTKPPDCSKCGPGCKAVYFTYHPNSKKKLAVYCLPDDRCWDPHLKKLRPCCDVCGEGRLGTPVFKRGTTVCIHGRHGPQERPIDDCGCGQRIGNKLQPDKWMDFEMEGPCPPDFDGWRCVCPVPCKKK